ncbi:MAG: ATP cone domain-containing protein [Bacteroidia bacterium]
MEVIKANGVRELFNEEKIRNSLKRVGAKSDIIDKVIDEVKAKASDGITTKALYKIVFRTLNLFGKEVAGKYNLKKAIMELGPTGFPFEKFIAEILKADGYHTRTGEFINGKCIKHEVDVIAEKESIVNMYECKYHTTSGKYCDIKHALYVNARFVDIGISNDYKYNKNFQGWLITNTRFTIDAEQYGNCAGLGLISWDYPVNNSLRDIINKSGMHPITCLTSISIKEKKELLNRSIVLTKNLCDEPGVLKEIGLSKQKIVKALDEAKLLCSV